jgi:hypothetical protein
MVITLLAISLCSQLVILQERELVQGSSVWFSAMERFTQLMAESLHSALWFSSLCYACRLQVEAGWILESPDLNTQGFVVQIVLSW